MIPITSYKGKNLAVLGLGRSGISAALALIEGGATVRCWDDDDACRRRAALKGLNISNLNSMDWQMFDALVLSPGIAHTFPRPHRIVHLAKQIGIPIVGDVELFAQSVNALPENARPRIVGVTGTNGKSTVVALIGHILRQAGLDVRVGGNIGHPVLDLEPLHARSVYVLELSSYQLEFAETLRCDVAAYLNISADHLERYAGMDAYRATKKRIFNNQTFKDWAIVGTDDPSMQVMCTALMGERRRNVARISSTMALPGGVVVCGGWLFDDLFSTAGNLRHHIDADRSLRGRHNHQNAAAAYACCRALGIDARRIIEGMSSFTGLPHRLEAIGEVGGVFFVNDSKATNADAAANGLLAYPGAHWIVGGQAKQDGISSIAHLSSHAAKAYLIGEAAEAFQSAMDGHVETVMCETLERAVDAAYADARAGGDSNKVVLLSPACASFDQYKSFEMRGDAFRKAVRRLEGAPAAVA